MPSRSALNALLLALAASSLSRIRWGAAAFYMPPEFDIDAVPGYEQTNLNAANSSSTAHPPSSTAGLFDVHNATRTETGSGAAIERQTASATSPSTHARFMPAVTGSVGAAGMEKPKAAPVLPRDIWSPRIIQPDADTVWTVGSMVKIVWDVSDPPHDVTNYEGKAVLGFLADGDDNNEHLQFEHPLAEGFNLTAGHVKVRVPDVDPRNEYIVVLFGDSGNRSPKFNIVS